ncbi:hypothetical protein ACJDU8_01890 [Clostridium sp. WILCCON 0269]|uniref:Uncharacterized protein n=1 Tax=Candidatus Clostridium eludens TaxID=3381663 RepID=A0ABW8SGH7_9CLOT
MKTVVSRIDLGMTRIAGYTLYDEMSHEFLEVTPKEVKALISCGQVNGLKLVNGEVELDRESFNMSNLMVKSGVGKFRTLFPSSSMANCMYAVVRVIQTDNGNLYEIVSNKCARVTVAIEHLKMLMEIGYVAGVKMLDQKIEICHGVTFEDKTSRVIKLEKTTQDGAVESKQNLNGANIENMHNLPVHNKNNLHPKQGLSNINTEVKAVESKNDEAITPVEKSDRADVIDDSVHTIAESKALGGTSDDTTIIHDSTEKNKKDNQPKEQVNENKLTTNRNTKKK